MLPRTAVHGVMSKHPVWQGRGEEGGRRHQQWYLSLHGLMQLIFLEGSRSRGRDREGVGVQDIARSIRPFRPPSPPSCRLTPPVGRAVASEQLAGLLG